MVRFFNLSTASTIGASLFIALVGKGVQANHHCNYDVPYGVANATDTRRLAEAKQADDPLGFSLRRDLQNSGANGVNYGGSASQCNLCTQFSNFDFFNIVCNNDENSWADGVRSFVDDGTLDTVCEITVHLRGTCGINNVEVFINNMSIGDTTGETVDSPDQQCSCVNDGVCQEAEIFFEDASGIGFYNLNGTNTIKVLDGSTGADAQLCMDHAEIEVVECPDLVTVPTPSPVVTVPTPSPVVTVPTPSPTDAPTAKPTAVSLAPTCVSLSADGKCGGDPHFQPLMAAPFSYHGQFDGVLMASKEFSNGQGLDIHIRTTRVDNPYVSYSYISAAAVRVGNTDVLEVKEDGSILVNGVEEHFDGADTADFGEASIVKSTKGSMKQIVTFDITFPVEAMAIQIRANTKTGMLFVDVMNSAPRDAVGLLGSPLSEELLARDGKTDMTGAWNSFGEEWQVQSDEVKLFQDKDREPQHPASCVYEAKEESAYVRHGRRHLMENQRVTMAAASAACEGSSESKMQFCIDDVLAMGDVELAEDSFYN